MKPHPAKFNDEIMAAIATHLEPGWQILDPFAGVGTIFQLEQAVGVVATGVEIEEEWVTDHPRHYCVDFFEISKWFKKHNWVFDAIVTSPVYGNRMSDHHDAKDGSKRHTYKHYLERDLSPNNAGMLQWGKDYREFHANAWEAATELLVTGGLFVLNIKDHIRKGEVQRVSKWHTQTLLELGLDIVAFDTVNAPGLRHGQNYDIRQPVESIRVFQKVI